jgi:hypothetical protein
VEVLCPGCPVSTPIRPCIALPWRRPAAAPPRLSAALSAVGLSPPWRLPHPRAALSAVGSGPPHRSPCLRRIGKGPVIALPDSCSWFVYWEGSCDRTSMLPFETFFSEKITSLMFSVHCFSCSVRLIKAIQWLTTMGSDLGLTGLDLGSVIFYFLEIWICSSVGVRLCSSVGRGT